MLTRFLLPLFAILGFCFGIFSVVTGNQPTPVAQPVAQPAEAPYPDFIAGAGIIEAKSQNIAIGTALPGIVQKVPIKVGDKVKAGQILFSLDEREARAELAIRKANVAKAKAVVGEIQAALVDSKTLLQIVEAVDDKRAISTEELDRRRNAHLMNLARLETAKAQVLQAEAEVGTMQTFLERLTVRAPIDAEILQINLRPGEFAQATDNVKPLILLGDLQRLHVRVDIDENDAWRFNKNGKAVAYLRGNRDFKAELTLAYIEPYIVPKRSLTGDSTERVDTRVLQALYSFDPSSISAYVGQQMDVFIEVPKSSDPQK